MREIKFRFWNNVVGRMTTKNYTLPELHDEEVNFRLLLPMQFTGLLDKNGKEIFEGDITKDRYVIMYHKEKALFAEHFYSPFQNVWNLSSYPISSQGIEIIGNIHEHPHLLPNR